MHPAATASPATSAARLPGRLPRRTMPSLPLRGRARLLPQRGQWVVVWARSVIAGRQCHETHVNHLEPQAADPFHEASEGSLVRQVGTKGCGAWADGDFAVVELCR